MVDLITYGPRPPVAGETLFGDRFDLGTGGKGANQAVMCARLGADVTMVNAVGDDVFGTMTIEALRAEGVDVRHVERIEGASTGVAPIFVEPDGTNRIVVVAGANARMDPAVAATAVAAATAVDIVVGQRDPAARDRGGISGARDRGAMTILNPAPAAAIDRDLLGATDWLVPNEVEVEHLARALGIPAGRPTDPAMVDAIQAATGIWLVSRSGPPGRRPGDAWIPGWVAAPVVDVVDTTGAGDAFVGGLAVALASGAELERALRAACALASDSVRRPGTQSSFAPAATARRILANSLDVRNADHLPH